MPANRPLEGIVSKRTLIEPARTPVIFYRIFEEPPVAIAWPSGVQHLVIEKDSGGVSLFYLELRYLSGGKSLQVDYFTDPEQAVYTLRHGIAIGRPACTFRTFLERLRREGRAEITVGWHTPLHYIGGPHAISPWDARAVWSQRAHEEQMRLRYGAIPSR